MTTLAVTSVSSLRCQTSTLKTVRACLPLRKPSNSWDSAITPSTRRSSAKRLAALRCESQKPEAEHNILGTASIGVMQSTSRWESLDFSFDA